MRDPILQGLNQLADGLRPWVAERAQRMRSVNAGAAAEREQFRDAQSLLVFMWDNWNSLFRDELSYVERSLVSELREFRNRWAHQQPFCEADVYRFLDNAERLLTAVGSADADRIRELRLRSLHRLYESEVLKSHPRQHRLLWWPLILCLGCAAAIDFAMVRYFSNGLTLLLCGFITLLLLRVGYLLTLRESRPALGPRECPACSRIVYTVECPYCEAASFRSQMGRHRSELTKGVGV